ncbi:hypothetical protein H072_8023 [Dactylellina haptotyla CBS 200.50]|uniref:Ribosomal protein L7/L12 C-terminal domain-containing protein n=1 Tax=Dactylellina haptotyla (strain CBS 200.50) TaxID=1284197 RepID=S8BG52_DACHA|nr:hypothetical protein H072_8023 [Dactylellina haptotyla CBS 200.50]
MTAAPILRRSLARAAASVSTYSSSSRPLIHIVRKSCPQHQRRWDSTSAAGAGAANPKLVQIVDQISTLTLLETADLVGLLKERLNIPDSLLAAPAAPAGAAPAAAAAPVEEEAAAAEEKTLFNVKLASFDAAAKAKVIKEVKALLGLSLVDSKKFVESAPKMLKEGLTKDEAEKMKKTLEGLGAKIDLE